MSEIFFIIKTFVFTVVLIFILQVKLGTRTIEEHSIDLFYSSSIGMEIQKVADVGVKCIQKTWNKMLHYLIEKNFLNKDNFANIGNGAKEHLQKLEIKKNLPGWRELKFQLQRSKEYFQNQQQKNEDKQNDNLN